MADWTGRKIARVQIGELIARGGMAEIYLGEHETQGQVAVKVMRGLLETDAGQLARFRREAEVIGELKHPNIVHLVDYIIHDEIPCLVMEYIPGPSLATYMKALHDRRQRIPIAVVAQILRQVASALDYAHSNGMVHRDIKPANVLLRSPSQSITEESNLPLDVEPVLTDFGLVRLVDSTLHTTTGSVSGTPAYMSPEQARGEKVDHRTDIYSLGIMLYEMLAGVVPFQSDTTFGMLMKHINDTPPPIKGLSLEMYALIERTLAKDPNLRYESAGALANEFMALFNGQTISPGTLHMAEMARKMAESGGKRADVPAPSSTRSWRRLAFEVVLAIGLLGAIAYGFMRAPAASGAETPVAFNPNIPSGRVRFQDFSGGEIYMDQITLSLNNVEFPEEGKHYEGWLVSDTGEFRKIGSVILNAAGVGQVIFKDPDRQNIFQNYNHVVITQEADGVEVNQPAGEIVYSSIFPPEASIPVRNLLIPYEKLPLKDPLIQGLWYYSGSWISISINGDKEENITGLRQAYENGDEATLRIRTEEVINQIVGSQSDQFLDYNNDGMIDNTPGELPADGYGSFPNGSQNGYIQETALQAKLSSEAIDSTPNIRDNSDKLNVCVENMSGRLSLLLESALKLNETSFGPDMEPIIADLEALSKVLMTGNDANSNGLVEAIPGECGADGAYEYAYLMADMLIYPGADRVPPSGK